uniref:SCP domain-containing protein n=1 Tax=Acrobeloides nanus TaxID=290746 RepID=A0A914CUY6_9BILA
DYDCTLESYAQSWADRCIYPGHSPPSHRNGTGENMMMDIATMSPTDALVEATRLWWDEIRTCGLVIGSTTTYDDYNTSCVRGHFTQCTWARTTLIGCGVRFCENGTFYGVNKPGLVVVCNYKEAGNVIGQPITQIGNPCQTDSECTTFPGSTCDASMGLCQ